MGFVLGNLGRGFGTGAPIGGDPRPLRRRRSLSFPGLFLYDSSLITGADHILAFWAPALGLALVRMGRRFTVREAVLAGALTGATILTKYQGSYFFVPIALLVLFLAIRFRRIRPAVAWGLACLTVSSAHWLKNWIFYGDPFYPLLHKYLEVHPFHEGAADRMYWDAQFLLTGTFWEKVQKTLGAVVTSPSFPTTGPVFMATVRFSASCLPCSFRCCSSFVRAGAFGS